MARKNSQQGRRTGKGISLLPAIWARIDRLAAAQDKSRSEVVEEVLSLHLPVIADLRKTEDNSQPSEELELLAR